MLGWIIGEVLILRTPSARSWIEAVYFAFGLKMVALGLALGRCKRRWHVSSHSAKSDRIAIGGSHTHG